MRAVDCFCGEYLESRTDAGLFDELRRHTDDEHAGEYSDAQLKAHIVSNSYDVVGARA